MQKFACIDRYHDKNSVSIDDLELRTSRMRNRSANLLSSAAFGVAAVLVADSC
jgi:hypothetical protein